ncbi:NUDIX hydrolase [Catenulispora pinisilvae]|uniref:NUDIX hydrolase n=1 Tax=Catenulispora pinisilvae TaxID=2705253 RepID=UPI001892733F|nr:NUDIX domain-containing protein [Catenulispora pinisilvae]
MYSLRVSSCAVCLRDGQILLSRWVDPDDPARKLWSIPGGGIDHGEDPYDAAVREVREETGYEVAIDELLGMHTRVTPAPPSAREQVEFHSLRIFYAAHIVGGELRDEIGGSSDRAEWVGLDKVTGLPRDERVDIGIALARERPATGRHGHSAKADIRSKPNP